MSISSAMKASAIAHARRSCPAGVRRYAQRRGMVVVRTVGTVVAEPGSSNWRASDGLDTDEGVAFLHELPVLGHKRRDSAADLGLDLVEDFHGLDDTYHLAGIHRVANIYERGRSRRRRGVVDTGERRDDGDAGIGRS